MELADKIDQLERLRDLGSISEDDFRKAKEKLMGDPSMQNKGHGPILIHGIEERTFCTLMHISQLLNYSVIGVIVPIVMWILGKDKSQMVSRQGNRMMNWIISSFIYGCIAAVLCIVAIGIPLAFILVVLSVVFPIIAAIKANSGELWSYPLAIKFLPED